MKKQNDHFTYFKINYNHYKHFHQWGEWLDMYGLQLSTNIYQRIEWYALMNCLNYIKKTHFEGRYLEMNEKILLVKSIYNNRIGKPTEE